MHPKEPEKTELAEIKNSKYWVAIKSLLQPEKPIKSAFLLCNGLTFPYANIKMKKISLMNIGGKNEKDNEAALPGSL